MAKILIYAGEELKFNTVAYFIRDWFTELDEYDFDPIADIVFGRLDASFAALDDRLVWKPGKGELYVEEDESGRPLPKFDPAWWKAQKEAAMIGL